MVRLGFVAGVIYITENFGEKEINPIRGFYLFHTFTESLALGNAGLSFYENYSPKKFFRKF